MTRRFYSVISIICFCLLTLSPTAEAQQIPNSNFETFQTGFNGVGEQPVGWKASNVTQTVMGVTATGVLVNSNNAGRSGNCVYIHNEEVGALGITEPAPAYIALGTPWNYISGINTSTASGGTEGGMAFTYRPDTLELWVKRSYSSQETAHALVYLWSGQAMGNSYLNKGGSCGTHTRIDEEGDIRGTNTCGTAQTATLIGQGEWTTNQQISQWTLVKAPINYVNNSIPEKINVIIAAADYPNGRNASAVKAGSKLYADDFRLIYSSKVAELRLNNRPLNGFDKDTYSYTHSLGLGVTAIPTITAYRNGRQLSGSELTINYGTVGTPTTVTVRAGDNSSTTTYTLNFVSQQSTNPRPTTITVNGSPISNFNGYVTSYNVALPYGTTACPTVDVVKAEAAQTYTVTPCSAVPGSARVTVYAEDNSVSQTYTINFTVAALTDNTLQDILVNGTSIPGFSPTRTNYVVELPLGTTASPTITPVSAYPAGEQTIMVVNNGLTGTSTVTVAPAGSTQSRTYRLTFQVTASSYSYLQDLKVGGVTLAGFDSQVTSYSVELPRGTTVLPAITWTKGEANQTVTLTQGSVNGESRVTVQAQNGATTIYRIAFSVLRSQETSLQDIQVGGVSLAGFDPETLSYQIQLPSGTTAQPAITYTAADAAQTIRVTNGGINGVSTIRVTAEDPLFTRTYSVAMSVEQSADAQLSAILVAGDTIDGFDPLQLSYSYTLPVGTATCPDITVIKASAGQQVNITKPQLTGLATVEVIAETGGSSNIYTINFVFPSSNVATLDDITVGGSPIVGFDSETTNYTVSLPANSSVPAIGYTVGDAGQQVVVGDYGLEGFSLTVTAENGDTMVYRVAYDIAPSGYALLADIQIWQAATSRFVSLSNFAPTLFDYETMLAWRTATAPVINPIAAEQGQTIRIDYAPVNDTTYITVTAADGVTKQRYSLYFPVVKSNNATLSAIAVDDNSIATFHPNTYSYNVVVPYGTTATPSITFEKGLTSDMSFITEQKVKLEVNSLYEPSHIYVTAEDGTVATYTLTFTIDMSAWANKNYLSNILIDGIPVAGFETTTTTYNIELPYGTTALPDLSYVKMYPEQTVIVSQSQLQGQTTLTVKSNISGVADFVYRLNISVSLIPKVVLTGILADGTPIPNFDPLVKSYVLPITSLPAISYSANETEVVVDIENTHKQTTLKVADANNAEDTVIYTVYYYYTNDIVPNANFENWSPTAMNSSAVKPTGWNAHADVRGRFTCLVFSYTPGNEVVRSTTRTNGSYGVELTAKYETASTCWAPGMITLGTINSSGACVGGRTMSVGGGIDFRNTPDTVKLDYQYRTKDSDNMRFTFQLWNNGTNYSSAESVASVIHTDATASSSWVTMSKVISYNASNTSPKRMNIIINSSYDPDNSSNPENVLYGYTPFMDMDKLYADNLRIGYSSTLSDVLVNGVSIGGTTVGNYNYTAAISPDLASVPVVTAIGAVTDQEHHITLTDEVGGVRTATITSIAEDGSQSVYTLSITRAQSAVTELSGIMIGDTVLTAFDATLDEYYIPIANGTRYLPDVRGIKGEDHQTVSYLINNRTIRLIVTAENGNSKIYILNFVEQTAADATLADLSVEGYAIVFDAATAAYQVTLPAGSEDIPTIRFEKQSDGQAVVIRGFGVNDTAFVQVASEDSLNFFTYAIAFETPAIATSNLLTTIELNGLPLNGFASSQFDYTATLATTDPKVLYYTKEFAADTLSVELHNDSAFWHLDANRYSLHFDYTLSDNAYLADIRIAGASLSTFVASQYDYTVVWTGTALPEVVAVAGHAQQTISSTWIDAVTLRIVVVAENGTTQNEYQLVFDDGVAPSSNAWLADILLDNISISNFAPTTTQYDVVLPEGTTTLPQIAAVKGEDSQQVTMTTNGVSGTTTITVTAENGTQVVYTINFTVQQSSNALLANIDINNIHLAGFDPLTFDYSYELPFGTSLLPTVAYEKGHPLQTVTVSDQGPRGDYVITVVAEDGVTTNDYTITFSVALSANASLADLTVNGSTVAGFDPLIDSYSVILPYGTTALPIVGYTAGDSVQTITVVQTDSVVGIATVSVSSENGLVSTTYTVHFQTALSDNGLLNDIVIGGEPLRLTAVSYSADKDFDSEEFYYNIVLPYGSTVLPAITWVGQVADYHSITQTTNGVNGTSVLEVTSQDEMVVNEYHLSFSVRLSDNARLADILIEGESLPGFHPDTISYTVVYPIGTRVSDLPQADDFAYLKAEPEQTVVINQMDSMVVTLTVTAADGVTTFTYVVIFDILKSSNALLADILVDGISLEGFAPTVYEYTYLLPFGTTTLPTLAYVKSEESQTVDIALGFINDISYIYVTAEDGTESTYEVFFKVTDSNPGDIPTPEDICFDVIEAGVWKASTSRNNVTVGIFSTNGQMVVPFQKIPIIDPNEELCSPSSNGVQFRFDKRGQVYVYVFVYNNKTRIASGKFAY